MPLKEPSTTYDRNHRTRVTRITFKNGHENLPDAAAVRWPPVTEVTRIKRSWTYYMDSNVRIP